MAQWLRALLSSLPVTAVRKAAVARTPVERERERERERNTKKD